MIVLLLGLSFALPLNINAQEMPINFKEINPPTPDKIRCGIHSFGMWTIDYLNTTLFINNIKLGKPILKKHIQLNKNPMVEVKISMRRLVDFPKMHQNVINYLLKQYKLECFYDDKDSIEVLEIQSIIQDKINSQNGGGTFDKNKDYVIDNTTIPTLIFFLASKNCLVTAPYHSSTEKLISKVIIPKEVYSKEPIYLEELRETLKKQGIISKIIKQPILYIRNKQ